MTLLMKDRQKREELNAKFIDTLRKIIAKHPNNEMANNVLNEVESIWRNNTWSDRRSFSQNRNISHD